MQPKLTMGGANPLLRWGGMGGSDPPRRIRTGGSDPPRRIRTGGSDPPRRS